MPDDACAGTTHLLNGQLDPRLTTLVTVVKSSDSPGHLRPFGVVARVVIPAIVCEVLHAGSQARPALPMDEIDSRARERQCLAPAVAASDR